MQTVRSNGDEQFVMTYTNLPPQDGTSSGGSASTGSGTRTGASSSNTRAGRVIGPDGEPNKDAVIFNLRDGRVALIHRIYPNMQLAVFDSLDELLDPPDGLLGRPSGRSRPSHDHRAVARFPRRRRRRTAGRDRRRAAPALPRAGRGRALHDQGGAARRRDRTCEGAACRADHAPGADVGARGGRRQRRLRPGGDPAAGRGRST